MTISYLKTSAEEAAEEMRRLDYEPTYVAACEKEFSRFTHWVENRGVKDFDEGIFDEYALEAFGVKLSERKKLKTQEERRRMCIRKMQIYIKNGTLDVPKGICREEFAGRYTALFNEYLDSMDETHRTNTITARHYYLHVFSDFLEEHEVNLDSISTEELEKFFTEIDKPLASTHAFRKNVKAFLRWLYDTGRTVRDLSLNVLNDNYSTKDRCPTIVNLEDVKKALSLMDTTKPTNMRDYGILLVETDLGLRPSDVVNLKCSDINWEENKITLRQVKTGILLEQPLTAAVGNAIIRYLMNGRPKTDIDNVFVTHSPIPGKKLSRGRISEIIRKHLGGCRILCGDKRIGARPLRSTLASSVLQNGGVLSDVSSVLGHSSVETAKHYIGVDFDNLKKCALPIPVVKSTLYSVGKEGER
jgi:integrase/recombinase XerD